MKIAVLALVAAAVLGAAPAPAPAPASAHTAAAPSIVDVVVTAEGFTAPPSAAPGAVTLDVSTSDPEGAWLGLVRLKPGVALDDYLADLTAAFAGSIEASREVARQVVAHGGVAVLNGHTASSSQYLAPGVYFLVDYKEVGRPDFADHVRELRVSGAWNGATAPSARPHVVMYPTGEGARFHAPARIAAGEAFRVTNVSEQFNEAILMPLRDDLDGEDVEAWFARESTVYPFTGDPSGMVVLSPWLTQVVDLDLAPGRYALVSWAHDYETGRYHTAQGMHAVVELT